jgi:hypothetical protein
MAPPLLDVQLKEVRRPDRPAVGDRHPQMRDAGLEVVREAAHGSGQLGRDVGADAGGEAVGDGTRRRLLAGGRSSLELGPSVLWHLGRQVAHALAPGGSDAQGSTVTASGSTLTGARRAMEPASAAASAIAGWAC